MTQPFIDTDVIIRFLTGDDQEKQAAASTLFEQVEQGLLTIAASMEQQHSHILYSYVTDFDRFDGITRQVP